MAEIRKALLRCDSSAYDVSTVLDHPKTSVLAAHGTFGVVAVPGGRTAPPEQVSVNVAGQMLATADSNAKTWEG